MALSDRELEVIGRHVGQGAGRLYEKLTDKEKKTRKKHSAVLGEKAAMVAFGLEQIDNVTQFPKK